MWDWIKDQITISFGEAILNNLFLIIVVYIVSLGYLIFYINKYINKILEADNENENEDEEQRLGSTVGLYMVVSLIFITAGVALMRVIFISTAELAGYTIS